MLTDIHFHSQLDNRPRFLRLHGTRVVLGSSPECDVKLNHFGMDPIALELVQTHGDWVVQVRGSGRCSLGTTPLQLGSKQVWRFGQKLQYFPYILELRKVTEEQFESKPDSRQVAYDITRRVHREILNQFPHEAELQVAPRIHKGNVNIEHMIEGIAIEYKLAHEQLYQLAGECVRDAILLAYLGGSSTDVLVPQEHYWRSFATTHPTYETELAGLINSVRHALFADIDEMDAHARVHRLESGFSLHWSGLQNRLNPQFIKYLAWRFLKKQVKDILYGLGPLEDLVRMPGITEIMVNACDDIWIEIGNRLQKTGRQFINEAETSNTIQRVVQLAGRSIGTSEPLVDARLKGGGRINAVLGELAVRGSCLTIRRPASRLFTTENLINKGTLTPAAVEFLIACVRSRRSILLSGPTSSGKTTVLSWLVQSISHDERIICVEDTHELEPDHPHVLYLECRNKNSEGIGHIDIQRLVINVLRQRPDRIIVGEVRGQEAIEMLQAMNVGHKGSMTTIHANSAADSLKRLAVLLRNSGLPNDAIQHQIASGIDIVVQTERLPWPSEKRMITEITEVVRYDQASDQMDLRPIFQALTNTETGDKRLAPTGRLPSFISELIEGNLLKLELFLDDGTCK